MSSTVYDRKNLLCMMGKRYSVVWKNSILYNGKTLFCATGKLLCITRKLYCVVRDNSIVYDGKTLLCMMGKLYCVIRENSIVYVKWV